MNAEVTAEKDHPWIFQMPGSEFVERLKAVNIRIQSTSIITTTGMLIKKFVLPCICISTRGKRLHLFQWRERYRQYPRYLEHSFQPGHLNTHCRVIGSVCSDRWSLVWRESGHDRHRWVWYETSSTYTGSGALPVEPASIALEVETALSCPTFHMSCGTTPLKYLSKGGVLHTRLITHYVSLNGKWDLVHRDCHSHGQASIYIT